MLRTGSFAFALITIASLAVAPAATAQLGPGAGKIGVSPPRVELEIGPRPSTETIRVINFGDEPVEVNVRVHSWDLDHDNRVRLRPPTEQSLDQWMIINPLHFTIEPGRTQAVRFSVRPRVEPEPGEHRAMVYFEQESRPEPGAETSTFRTLFRLGVAVYGYVGEPTRLGTLHSVGVEDREGWFEVSSEGSAHVRLDGQVAVWPVSLYPGSNATTPAAQRDDNSLGAPPGVLHAALVPTTPILPGTRRKIRFPIPGDLPPGSYVLDVNASLGDRPLEMAVPFMIPAALEADAGEAQTTAEPAG